MSIPYIPNPVVEPFTEAQQVRALLEQMDVKGIEFVYQWEHHDVSKDPFHPGGSYEDTVKVTVEFRLMRRGVW